MMSSSKNYDSHSNKKKNKHLLSILFLFLVLLFLPLSLANTQAFAQSAAVLEKENILLATTALPTINPSFSSDFYEREIAPFTPLYYDEVISKKTMNEFDSALIEDSVFENEIYLADEIGRPKYHFNRNDNIYLVDRRLVEHKGLYEPGATVHLYLFEDLSMYQNDLKELRIVKTSTIRNKNSELIATRLTIQLDDQGRIPFTNLGTIDDLFDMFPDKKRFTIDMFIDAKKDQRYDRNGYYYQPAGSVRGIETDGDHYTWPESPAISVNVETKTQARCCQCQTNNFIVQKVTDALQCAAFCKQNNQEFVSYGGECNVQEQAAQQETLPPPTPNTNNNNNAQVIIDETDQVTLVVEGDSADNNNGQNPDDTLEASQDQTELNDKTILDSFATTESKAIALAIIIGAIALVFAIAFFIHEQKKRRETA